MANPIKESIKESIVDKITLSVDSIQYAAQIGRLDFVSALLAAVALIMAFSGIVAFFNIKRDAREAAETIAKSETERIVNLYIQNNLSIILSEYDKFIDEHVNSKLANQIAQAQEDSDNGTN